MRAIFWIVCVVALLAIIFFAWFMDEDAQRKGQAFNNHYGHKQTGWGCLWYFALLFLAILLLPLFAK